MLTRPRRVVIAAAIVVTALHWVNTRVAMVLTNQDPAHPIILSTYPTYQSMATGLREGRVGQVDLAAVQRHSSLHDLTAPFEPLPRDAHHEWVSYYSLDIGYSFIVEAAHLAFPTLPDNHLRGIALQLAADAALVLFVFFVFSQWNAWIGLLAAYLYVSNFAFCELVSFAYYYYWDVPLTFVAFGSMILAYHRPAEARRWLALAGAVLGFGVWMRGSWWPLSLFLLVAAATSPVLRKHLLAAAIAFAIVATPQVVRSSIARGQLTLSTRAVWHVAMVGLGYYPNPYGLGLRDEIVFNLTRDKYGVPFRSEDYYAHDQAAKKEFLSIWQKDRGFVIRSFLGRLKLSFMGRTESSVPSFEFRSNVRYRLACLAGLLAMFLRGGEKRVLALAAGGTHVIYVVLTSAFFYVGLAYSNVTEVTLLILFIGGIEAALYAAERVFDDARLAAGA